MGVEFYDESEIDPVLRAVCGNWINKIRAAQTHKRDVFSKGADECQQFFDGPKDWNSLMGGGTGMGSADGFPDPAFKISINKTFEFVTIFGPALYYENPVRTAKPRMPVIIPPMFFPDPSMYAALGQQENTRIQTEGLIGTLLEAVMNWSPNDFDLAGEARSAINEALIKGRGCAWVELYQPPAANFRAVRTSYDSVEGLLVDPDAESLKRAKWIARKQVMPVWDAERQFGLRPGSLKGSLESMAKQADVSVSEDLQYERKKGQTNDLIVIYKIFSKMGIGGRMQGADKDRAAALDIFGDYCYLVIADGVPFPLNLPPDICNDKSQTKETIFARTNWPTPFWASVGWPVQELDFHEISGSPWPTQHLKAGMGELKALNWIFSFMLGKLHTTLRDLIAVRKSLSEEIKTTILNGDDLSLIELDAEHGTIDELIKVLQFPSVNGDVWKMIEAVGQQFDKRVGLTELMYGDGGATQIRSAGEADIRNQNMNVRPEDMSKQVEAWMSKVAVAEAVCLRYHLHGNDVSPILGPMAAMAWDQYVSSQDISIISNQLEYQIEAGSTRRPNKNAQGQQMSQGFQTLSPIISQYATATGDIMPLNNLIADYAKSLDLDPARYQLTAPIPPPQPPAGPAGSETDPNADPAGAAPQ